jgi:hypothetical protein
MNETTCPEGHEMYFVDHESSVADYYWCNGCHKGYIKSRERSNANAI